MEIINTKSIFKYKGAELIKPIAVEIAILDESVSIREQLDLQDAVINNLKGQPFLLRKKGEAYQKYRNPDEGVMLGVFAKVNRCRMLIAQTILYTQTTDTRPANESISESIGRGLEVGNIMVHPDFLGNGLSRILIENVKSLVDGRQEINADYLIFRVHADNHFSYRSILKQEGSFIGRTETARFPNIEDEIKGINIFCPLDIGTFSSKLEEKDILIRGTQRESNSPIILSSGTFTYRAFQDKIDRRGEIITLEDNRLISKKIEVRRRERGSLRSASLSMCEY